MQDISFLIDYHIWAVGRVLQQMKDIPDEEWTKEMGGSFPSLNLVCKHLIGADYRWMQRWKGVSLAAIPEAVSSAGSYTQVAAAWQSVLEEMRTEFDSRKNELDRLVSFTTAKGAPHTLPLWQTVYQVVNHGTYHRGQITNMLRMLGRQPVGTDMFTFFVEKGIR